MIRRKWVPIVVVVLASIALATIVALQSESSNGRDAQLKLANLKTSLSQLQSAPFQASTSTGGSPAFARGLMARGKREVAQALASLRSDSPPAVLATIDQPLLANYAALDEIYAIGASGASYGARADQLAGVASETEAEVNGVLIEASRSYDSRASTADNRATLGAGVTIALLLAAFLFLYRLAARARSRAEGLAEANRSLAADASRDARTDALTGLGNRRALAEDFAVELGRPADGQELAVALFDLDGFKQYNDTFGHPAGDSLLARLSGHLMRALAEHGTAYRMGGDEFCLLARVEDGSADALVTEASEALTEVGDGFRIECSYGLTMLPSEASSPEAALQLADRRMYDDKAGRSSAGRQSADVLLEVINERSLDLRDHIRAVALHASATAEILGVPEHEVARIGLAAELHDIGKAAIPDTILNKPGPLDESEAEFIRSHTVIGERIVLAAPSLAPLAPLVRSSHERFDGWGYPDGLKGDEIPIGAVIIGVCDAYDAMVADRPYSPPMSTEAAREELQRAAGAQFDPKVVAAYLSVPADSERLPVSV
jgi:diguanylate cyclase (GGDEF)-like protein